jgi:hypothetical protein
MFPPGGAGTLCKADFLKGHAFLEIEELKQESFKEEANV